MKIRSNIALVAVLFAIGSACKSKSEHLMLDVHHLEPGKVDPAAVAEAHQKDLAVQGAHGVSYQRYWVDAAEGTIYCLVEAPSAEAACDVHRAAHGLVADEVNEVVPGILPAKASGRGQLFMDSHRLGTVHAEDVAEAHRKDLAVESAHGVRFLNYWVDEKNGMVYCLAEAPNAEAVTATHREAHGLLPDSVRPVVEGH
jgi:uncharacterized protein DUF4242